MSNTTIIKLGGSVITDKSKPFSIRVDVLTSIAADLSTYLREASGDAYMALVHGGGSFGHPLVRECLEREGVISKECFTRVAHYMTVLNAEIVRTLMLSGVPAVSTPTRATCVALRNDLADCNLSMVKELVHAGVIPVMFGDVAPMKGGGFKVISGDVLVWLLAKELGADTVIFLTDVDGIFTTDPRLNPGAELIPEVQAQELVRGLATLSTSTGGKADVTGAMKFKIEAGLRLGVKGVKALIINGLKPHNLINALQGRKVRGTVVWF